MSWIVMIYTLLWSCRTSLPPSKIIICDIIMSTTVTISFSHAIVILEKVLHNRQCFGVAIRNFKLWASFCANEVYIVDLNICRQKSTFCKRESCTGCHSVSKPGYFRFQGLLYPFCWPRLDVLPCGWQQKPW